MQKISGIDVPELPIAATGGPVIVATRFNPRLPVLIEITATADTGKEYVELGHAIINDYNEDNNYIKIEKADDFFGDVIWLKIIVAHPDLKNYDFLLDVIQADKVLYTFNCNGTLATTAFLYQGFIVRNIATMSILVPAQVSANV